MKATKQKDQVTNLVDNLLKPCVTAESKAVRMSLVIESFQDKFGDQVAHDFLAKHSKKSRIKSMWKASPSERRKAYDQMFSDFALLIQGLSKGDIQGCKSVISRHAKSAFEHDFEKKRVKSSFSGFISSYRA